MNPRAQKILAASGPVFMVLLGVGLLLAGLIPPPSPHNSAAQIVQFYHHDTIAIRTGLQLAMVGSALLVPWSVALFLQMRRMEGGASPWAYVQLGAGIASLSLFFIPIMVLQAAIFRIDQMAPQIVQTLHDITWITFVSAFSPGFIQFMSIGIATLQQKTSIPVFPRWAGYFSVWMALVFTAGFAVPYFKEGPLAWNGVFTWWIPLVAFGCWIFVMFGLLIRSINSQALEEERHQVHRLKETDV